MTLKTTITVRDIDPGDKIWLQTEAAQHGLSMEAFVRQLIHENGNWRGCVKSRPRCSLISSACNMVWISRNER